MFVCTMAYSFPRRRSSNGRIIDCWIFGFVISLRIHISPALIAETRTLIVTGCVNVPKKLPEI